VSPHKADTVGENKEVRLHEMRGIVVYIYILLCMTCGSSGPVA
jgi:hypothetical protein